MGREAAADGGDRQGEAVLLGREHLEELPAASRQADQSLRRGVWQGPGLRAHALGEERQDTGVDSVGLGELAGALGKVAHLAGVGDDDGQPQLGVKIQGAQELAVSIPWYAMRGRPRRASRARIPYDSACERGNGRMTRRVGRHRRSCAGSLLAALLIGWAMPARALEYTSPSGDFSLRLPDGWVVMPPEGLRALESTLRTADGSALRIDVAFQPAGRAPLAEPILLVTRMPGAQMSVGQLFEALAYGRDALPRTIAPIPGSRIEYGPPTLDRRRAAVRLVIDVHRPGGDVSRSLVAILPGRMGSTHLVVRTSPGRAQGDERILDAVLDRFQYAANAAPAPWQRRGPTFALHLFGFRIGGVLATVLLSTAGALVVVAGAMGLAKLLAPREDTPEKQ